MGRLAVVACVLLLVGAVAMLRLRAQWIERKVAAAMVTQPVTRGGGASCEPGRRAVIITGDSRVAQWPLRLFDGLPVANTGIAGETALQLTARFDRDVLACRPDAVMIASGVNDLVAASLASDAQAQRIVAALPGHLIAMVEKAARAGAAVTIATIIPPGRPDLLRRVVWSDDVRRAVATVNAQLRAHRWPESVTLLDFAAALDPRGTGVLPDRFRRDTLHLNGLAYACLTPLLPFVARTTRDPSPECEPGKHAPDAGGDERGGVVGMAAG